MPLTLAFFLICLLLYPGFVLAQLDGADTGWPPKYLQIVTEETVRRPEKATGPEYHRAPSTEGSIQAGADQYFLGAAAIAGPSETLWLVFHNNLSDFEKQIDASALRPMAQGDSHQAAKLMRNNRNMLARRRDDLSYRPDSNLGEYKFMAIHTFHSKLGHTRDVMEVLRILNSAREKSGSEIHIVAYEVMSGDAEGTLLSIVPRKSLAEMEQGDQRMQQTVGEDGWRRIRELADAGGFTLDNTLFAFEPTFSHVSAEMAAANSAFWDRRLRGRNQINSTSPQKPR
jgi:hypothetical protein